MARGPASGGAERSGGEGAARRGRSGGGRGGAMDRVSSSMKQVSNPLPKVLSRRAGGSGLEAERESFERAQTVSINKAINAQEVAVKEKHARNILPKVGRGTSKCGSGARATRKRGSSKVARGERSRCSQASATGWLLGC
ncbi:uncharacterized protein ACIBXB_021494 [Morphnus guianensis]